MRNDPQHRLPKALLDQPELSPGLELYWKAFGHLNSCRPAGFSGAYPIPWTAIKTYADTWGLDEVQFELLEFFIGKMDEAFLKWAEKKNGNSDSATPSSGKKFGQKC